MILNPFFDLNRLTEALIETLEELSALLLRDRLDEATEAGDLHMPLLEQFLHLLEMHAFVQRKIVVAILNFGLVLDELQVVRLGLRLCFDQFAHLIDHLLVLGEELRPIVDLLLQIAMRRHENPFLLVIEDAQRPAYRLLEHPSDFHGLTD